MQLLAINGLHDFQVRRPACLLLYSDLKKLFDNAARVAKAFTSMTCVHFR